MSIYTDLKEAGVSLDQWQSDLYALKCPASEEILKNYKHKHTVTTFISQIDGKVWYDIPFAFDPYWERRTGK